MPDARHVYHIYAIRTKQRQAWQDALQAQGIQTGIHYPFPVHLLPAFADLGYKAGISRTAEQAATEVMSLPMYPELTEAQCVTVARAVRSLAGVAEEESLRRSTPASGSTVVDALIDLSVKR